MSCYLLAAEKIKVTIESPLSELIERFTLKKVYNPFKSHIFLAAKSHNYFNISNCITIASFLYLGTRKPFLFSFLMHLSVITFVCCFHLYKIIIIIAFIAIKPFHYISIFKIFLLLQQLKNLRALDNFQYHIFIF